MSEKDRLTRDELSWLLTQEARGAADRLRQGVQILTRPPPPMPAPERPASRPPSERPLLSIDPAGLESSLELLESTMDKLTEITSTPAAKSRKGRVDLAALVWEVAPDAKVQLSPGDGTEVYGDPRELRRMLNVLLGSTTGAGQVVELARKGTDVVLSVTLGPDISPLAPPERRWLSRMAVRYGGRYELEGSREMIALPADMQQREMENLRKELEAAKAQGEAYARELASFFMEEQPPSVERNPNLGLASFAKLASAIMEDLRTIFGPLGAARANPRDHERLLSATQLALSRGARLLSVARGMSAMASDSGAITVDITAIIRDEATLASPAFSSAGVSIVLAPNAEGSDSWVLTGLPSALRALFGELLERCARLTKSGDEVRISIRQGRMIIEITSQEPMDFDLASGSRIGEAFVQEIVKSHNLSIEFGEQSITVTASQEGS